MATRRSAEQRKQRHLIQRLQACQTITAFNPQTCKHGLVIRSLAPSCPPVVRQPFSRNNLPDRQLNTTVTRVAQQQAPEPLYIVEHSVKLPTLAHLDWFWRRPVCRALGSSIFPNCKEITESVSG